MKTLSTIIIIILLSAISCFAQKFKVTAFTGNDKRFDEVENQVMGQTVILVVYDTSVSLKIANDPADIIHKVSENNYIKDLSKPQSKETMSISVKLNKTFNYISSIEVSFNVAENQGQYRKGTWTLTAKRE